MYSVIKKCEMLIVSLPGILGECTCVNSTKDSLTFTFKWKSATSDRERYTYKLVGDRVSETSSVETVTVKRLQPGTWYTFNVWAVGELSKFISNNITCANSTGKVDSVTIYIALY